VGQVFFSEPFSGFDERSFQAFEKRKWSSNMFNMERLAVREQLRALGKLIEGKLNGLNDLKWDVTTHTPSVFNQKSVNEIVLFFTRPDREQKAIVPLLDSRTSLPDQISNAGEHHRHVTMGVRIDGTACEVGLMLYSTAWLDVMNLLNRCRVSFEKSSFVEKVNSLPKGTVVRFTPEEEVDAVDFDAGHVDVLEKEVLNEAFLIFAGRSFEADSGETVGGGFVDACVQVLQAMFPVWKFVAWRPEADYLEVADESRRLRSAGESGTADLEVGWKVRILEGVFAGREGTITEMDHKGFVKVMIGKVVIRTQGKSLHPA